MSETDANDAALQVLQLDDNSVDRGQALGEVPRQSLGVRELSAVVTQGVEGAGRDVLTERAGRRLQPSRSPETTKGP